MSIGYDGMHPGDFNSYMMDTYAFKYDKKLETVRAFVHMGIGESDSGWAKECTATMYSPETGRNSYVSVSDLFERPEWITHRFPTGYVAVNGGRQLVRIALEPWERRMRKGLDFNSLRTLPVVDTVEGGEVPEELISRITPHRLSVKVPELVDGICTQLAYGQTRCFATCIPADEATERSKKAVLDLLNGSHYTVAINPELALIRTRAKVPAAMVLNNGRLLGTVTLAPSSGGVLFTSCALRDYSTKEHRRIARAGIESLALRTIADRVEWSY